MELWSNFWPLLLACLAVSFLLSGMEAGVFALSRLRIRQQTRAGRPSARALYHYLENPENFLWTILVGNTLANFFILGWLFITLYQWFRGHKLIFVLIFALAVFIFYAFFDLLPKTLFRSYPNRLCMLSARPFGFIHFLLRPLVFLVEGVSRSLLRWRGGTVFTGHLFGNREEFRIVMQESAQVLSSEERVMINRVMDLQTLTVRTLVTPLSQTVTIPADMPVSEVLRLAREKRLGRFPVWEKRGNQRHIFGLINVNNILFSEESVHDLTAARFVQPALYLEEDTRLEVAMRRMQRSGHRLAIVVGRDRVESGILSLQDILKFIFGEVTS